MACVSDLQHDCGWYILLSVHNTNKFKNKKKNFYELFMSKVIIDAEIGKKKNSIWKIKLLFIFQFKL